MSVSVIISPSIYKLNKIPDDKLPEGRISIPFSTQFVGPDASSLPINGLQGAGYKFDPSAIRTASNLSAIKSVSFSAEFIAAANSKFPTLVIFVEGSFQRYEICPPTNPLGTSAVVSGVVEIISNPLSAIWFVATGALLLNVSQINLFANANNFEMKPWVSVENAGTEG